tara:strand:- start:482 stop:913 length:432 start_codon:yes stop_codon:yes gene_type:complete
MNKEKSPIINLIARKTNQSFNKDLSQQILGILCENRKTIGVFKNMLVSDIRNQIVNTNEFDLGKTRDEQDLSIRIELYKLKNKGYVDFEYYKKDKYSVKSNIKGLEFCKVLLINQLIDEGLSKEQINNIEVIEDEELWVATTY